MSSGATAWGQGRADDSSKERRRREAEEVRALETALAFAETRVEILEASLGLRQEFSPSPLRTITKLAYSQTDSGAGDEDDRVEEDIHRIIHYAKNDGALTPIDRYGVREMNQFLLNFKFQQRAEFAVTRLQSWWRMRIRRIKFLKVRYRRQILRARFFNALLFYVKSEKVFRRFVRRRFLYRWRAAKDDGVAARKLIMQMTHGKNEKLMLTLLSRMERHGLSIAKKPSRRSRPCSDAPIAAEALKNIQGDIERCANEQDTASCGSSRKTFMFADPAERQAVLAEEKRRSFLILVREMAERNQKRRAIDGWLSFIRWRDRRRLHAMCHLLRMTRLSQQRHDKPMWVGERLQLIFEMWHRWAAFHQCLRNGKPSPVFATDFQLWDEWLQAFTRLKMLKGQAAQREPRMMLIRYFRKIRAYRDRSKRKRENARLAAQQYEHSRLYYVLVHWSAQARKRGSLLRRMRHILVAWFDYARRKSRLRVVKQFLSRNMRSDTKRYVLKLWKQRYEDIASLRMYHTDRILRAGNVRNAQLALHAVYMWQQDVAHVYLIRVWWAWRRVCEGRRRWKYARFVYLRGEAHRIQKEYFSVWTNVLQQKDHRSARQSGRKPRSANPPSSRSRHFQEFNDGHDLRQCIEEGSRLPSLWTVEDENDTEALKSWMLRRKQSPNAPRWDTPLHHAVESGKSSEVKQALALLETAIPRQKLERLEQHKLRMFKQLRKANVAETNSEEPASECYTTLDNEATHITMANQDIKDTLTNEEDSKLILRKRLENMDKFADYAVDTRNEQGLTCLHLGARHMGDEGFRIVVLLIKSGASVFAEDDEGRTPAQVATDPRSRAYLEMHAGRLRAGEFTPFERFSYRHIRIHASWAHLSSVGFWRTVISASSSTATAVFTSGVSQSPISGLTMSRTLAVLENFEELYESQQDTIALRTKNRRNALERDKIILARAVVRQQLAEKEAEELARINTPQSPDKRKSRAKRGKPSAYLLKYLEETTIPHAGEVRAMLFREPAKGTQKSSSLEYHEDVLRTRTLTSESIVLFQKVLGPKPTCSWALDSGIPNRRAGASTMRAYLANLTQTEDSLLKRFEQSYGGLPGDREHEAALVLHNSLQFSDSEAKVDPYIASTGVEHLEAKLNEEAKGRLSAAWKLAAEVRAEFVERLGEACSYLNSRKYDFAQRVSEGERQVQKLTAKVRSCHRSRRLTAHELTTEREKSQAELTSLEGEIKVAMGRSNRFDERISQLQKDLDFLRMQNQLNNARGRALKKELAQQQELFQQAQSALHFQQRQKAQIVSASNDSVNETIRRLGELESKQTAARAAVSDLKEELTHYYAKIAMLEQMEESMKNYWLVARTKLEEEQAKRMNPTAIYTRSASFQENILLDYQLARSATRPGTATLGESDDTSDEENDEAEESKISIEEANKTAMKRSLSSSTEKGKSPIEIKNKGGHPVNLSGKSKKKRLLSDSALGDEELEVSKETHTSSPRTIDPSKQGLASGETQVEIAVPSRPSTKESFMSSQDGDDLESMYLDGNNDTENDDDDDDDDDDQDDDDEDDDEDDGSGSDEVEETDGSGLELELSSDSEEDESSDNDQAINKESKDHKEGGKRSPKPILQMKTGESSTDSPASWGIGSVRGFSPKDVSSRPTREEVLLLQNHSKRQLPLDQDPVLQLNRPLDPDHPLGRKVVASVQSSEIPKTREYARKSSVVIVRDENNTIDRKMSLRRLEGLFSESRKLLFNGEVVSEEVKIGKTREEEQKIREQEEADRRKFEEEARAHLSQEALRRSSSGLLEDVEDLESARLRRISSMLERRRGSIDRRLKQLTPRGNDYIQDDDLIASILWEKVTKMNTFVEYDRPNFFFANFIVAEEEDSLNSEEDKSKGSSDRENLSGSDQQDSKENQTKDPSQDSEDGPNTPVITGPIPFRMALWKSQEHCVSIKLLQDMESKQEMSFAKEKTDPYLKMARQNEVVEWKVVPDEIVAEVEAEKRAEDELSKQKPRPNSPPQMVSLSSISFLRPASPKSPHFPTKSASANPLSRPKSDVFREKGTNKTTSPLNEELELFASSLEHNEGASTIYESAEDEDNEEGSTDVRADTIGPTCKTKPSQGSATSGSTYSISPPEFSKLNSNIPRGNEIESKVSEFFTQVDELLHDGEISLSSDMEPSLVSNSVHGNSSEKNKCEHITQSEIAKRPITQNDAIRVLRSERAVLKSTQLEMRGSISKQGRAPLRSHMHGPLRELSFGRQLLGHEKPLEGTASEEIEVLSSQFCELRTSKTASGVYRPANFAEQLQERVQETFNATKRCASAISMGVAKQSGDFKDLQIQAHRVIADEPSVNNAELTVATSAQSMTASNIYLPPRHDFATARRQGIRRARRAKLEPLQPKQQTASSPSLLFIGQSMTHSKAI